MLKKCSIVALCMCLILVCMPDMTVYAAPADEQSVSMVEVGEPLAEPETAEEGTEDVIQDNHVVYEGPATNASKLLTEPVNSDYTALVKSYGISLSCYVDSNFTPMWSYYSDTPNMISFYDGLNRLNVAYVDPATKKLQIQRYNDSYQLVNKLQLTMRYPLLGNITADSQGNYYVIWGQSDSNDENCVTMCISKYSYSGQFIAECAMNGYDTYPYSGDTWGTKYPFDAGNCSVALNNGVLACNYGREMYSGHQSNFVIYVDCNTMKRIPVSGYGAVPYCSHSFDQRVISLSNGDFLMADHGDAYSRGFQISVADTDGCKAEFTSFHFREGANRDYGYNETYAQLGGIAETANGYVLCGSSEKTLSLANAPTNEYYCGHSEARDLFVQILKKDFYNYSGAERYLVSGETRVVTGSKPTNSLSKLWLTGNEVDYGVIWLTDYDDAYYAANPKVISTPDNKIVVMWEKLSYETNTGTAYFAVLNEDGTVYQDTLEIPGVRLAGNIDPVYKDGKIYWATGNMSGTYIHELTVIGMKDVNNVAPEKPYKIVNVVSGIHVYWKSVNTATQYGVWRSDNGKDGTYKWIANTSAVHYTDTTVESGKTYFYKISVYNAKLNKHYDKSEALGMIFVGTPDLTLRVNRSSGIGLGWNAIEGATGYAIYRKTYAGIDNWVRVATIQNPSTLTWTDTSVKENNGTIYRYTVRALGGAKRNYLSGCRTTGRTMVRMTTRSFLNAAKVNSTSVKCKWMTTSACDGYEVRFMVGNTVYKTFTVGNYKTYEKTFSGLKAGQNYKIQVRSYKKVSGVGTFYSAWSEAKYVNL